jgi:hypothetical protein
MNDYSTSLTSEDAAITNSLWILAARIRLDERNDFRGVLAREQAKDDAAREAEWAYDAKIAREEREHYERLDSEDREREERDEFISAGLGAA